MKTKIFIFSSLVCMCGVAPVAASDCVGDGCYLEPIAPVMVDEPTVLGAPIPENAPYAYAPAPQPQYNAWGDTLYAVPAGPMRSVKLLSIKPVPADSRAPVWDGTRGNYAQRGYDKTVDWRDGVPIWDDSVSSYKYKDYSDWFLQPMPELYIRDADAPAAPNAPVATVVAENPFDAGQINVVDLYKQNMADAAATRARVEELLRPKKPTDNLWTDNVEIDETDIDSGVKTITTQQNTTVIDTARVQHNSLPGPRPEFIAQDLTELVTVTFGRADGCPFETETECEIWRRKPIVRETVSPRSPKIRADKMDEFIAAARMDKNITANHPLAAPLLERYKMLMGSANACCTDGMAYSLKQAGASDGLVYKFLSDDANFYGLGARCLMITDAELDAKYPNTATAMVVADVRNGCLCRGRQWFYAMLAPFEQAYKAFPEFKDYKFNYTYTDGLQREITVSVNNDVQNVLKQLSVCP